MLTAQSDPACVSLPSLPSSQCKCGCPGRWRDHHGGIHCEFCNPPPAASLVASREILLFDGSIYHWAPSGPQTASEEFWDPFGPDPPPPGVWFAAGDPVRVAERELRERNKVGTCLCAAPAATEPCRGGEWVRVFCSNCNRTIRIDDAP